jgi:integrase
MQNLSDAKASATAAGVTVNETETRKTIKAEAAKFVKSAVARGAMEAADVNKSAMAAFQLANPRLVYVDEITADSATTFWRYLKKAKKSDRTIYNAHMRLTGFLKFARVDYKAWGLRAPRYEKKLPDMYSPGEIDRMLASCKRDYNKVLISILAKTGLRDQELMHLCWTDIDLAERILKVTGKPDYEWEIKDYEQRILPLPSDLNETLKAWRKANPKTKLVLGTVTDNPNTKYLLALKSVAKNAGVLKATLHRFRRTYCTNLLRGGMDIRTVQMLMGHSDLASTMRYLTPATGDDVRNKIDEILNV